MMDGFPSLPIPSMSFIAGAALNAGINMAGAAAVKAVFSDRWGIYSRFGVPVLLADTVVSVDFSNSSDVSSAPVERGSFTSYNKVDNPYEATVSMTRGGNSAVLRGAFLAQIEAISRSSLLYHVITPDYVHRNANVTGFRYSRTPNMGARMITVDVFLTEVRQSTVKMDDLEQVSDPADSLMEAAGQIDLAGIGESLLSQASDVIGGFLGGLGGGG